MLEPKVKKITDDDTVDEIQEKELIRCKQDIHYFANNYVYVLNNDLGEMLFEPRDYQTEMLDAYMGNRFVCNVAPRQSLSLETDIPTPLGFVKLKNLKLGDIVFDQNGNKVTIINLTDTYIKNECFKITFDTGETIIADSEHLWKISHSDWNHKEQIKTTEQMFNKFMSTINRTKKSSLYINMAESVDYDKKNLPIDPYTLGIWLGDGDSHTGRITCSVDDYNELYKDHFNVGLLSLDKRRNTTGSFSIKGLYVQLKKHGLLKNKHIPNNYKFSSLEQRLLLVQGLMDSDGTVIKNKGSCVFYQKDENLIDEFREILFSLGIKNKKRRKTIKSGLYKNSIHFAVSFSTTKPVFKLKRKLDIQKQIKNHPKNKRQYIHDIKRVKSEPVKCVTVDSPDHLFLCSKSYIPTHNCGKTQTTVVFLLHQTIFYRFVQIGCTAQTQLQAKEILERYKFSYERLPSWMKPAAKVYNELSVKLANGSGVEIAATTPNTFRGKSKKILYLDEFSHVKENIIQEFWKSLLPVISSAGSKGKTKIFLSSTPNGTEGLFAKIYHDAVQEQNSFFPLLTDPKKIPGRDEEWKRNMIRDCGSYESYLQEFECHWISSKGTLINPIKLESIKSVDPIKERGDLRLFDSIKDKKLVVAVDVGTGIGKDYSAIQVFDVDTLTQVAEYRNNVLNTLDFTKEFIRILKYFISEGAKEVYYSFENNSIGNTVMAVINASDDMIFADQRVNQIDENYKTQGLTTTQKSKLAGCMVFKSLIENDSMTIKSKFLVSELKFFVKAGQTFKAEGGMNDDLVMSCVILCNMLKKIAYFEEGIYNAIHDTHINVDDDDDSPLPFITDDDIDKETLDSFFSLEDDFY